ncbi:acyltransferase [Actimicrobium antarcticum]|uniref:Acyltransferase n=1 Tax=Actimicrobium antarcticum TaxID=1051899 RepID=A0ABP7SRY5_9BURK
MSIPKKQPLAALTSLRFFAALAIVVHHCNGVFWPVAALGPLDVGVSFFFVLSGFILTWVYHDQLALPGQWRRFYRARLARIWPLHLTCLLLTLLLVAVPEPFNVRVLTANALLLHAWIPFDRYFFSYNYVSWTISTELFFYLLFPLVIRFALRWRNRTLLLAVLLALTTVLLLGLASWKLGLPSWQIAHDHMSSTGLLYTNPLARFAEFLCGMVVSLVFIHSRHEYGASRLRWTVLELASVALLLLGYRYVLISFAPVVHEVMLAAGATHVALTAVANESALLGQLNPFAAMLIDEWANHVGLTPFVMLLVIVFAHQRGALSHALSQRWLVLLGELSFALYLVHQIVLRVAQQHGLHGDWSTFFAYGGGILLLALALHRLVEQPARRWMTGRT